MRGCKRRLSTLLVGVGPVENLFFNKLARGQRLERRARQVQIGPGRYGQEFGLRVRQHGQVFVDAVQLTRIFQLGLFLGDCIVFALKQLLGGVAPGTKVVFVKHHQIPIHRVQPLVARLDVARCIAAQQVLKRAEIHHRLVFVDLRGVAPR